MKKPSATIDQAYLEAIKAHTEALRENTAALTGLGGHAAAAAGPTGCCTISAPGVRDRQIEKVTQAQCVLIARAIPGAVPHWIEGDCAM
jgi:hypothetical protein